MDNSVEIDSSLTVARAWSMMSTVSDCSQHEGFLGGDEMFWNWTVIMVVRVSECPKKH